MKPNQYRLINIEWNCYNGVIFEFIYIDSYGMPNIDKSLFSINCNKRWLILNILFMEITIFDKTGL